MALLCSNLNLDKPNEFEACKQGMSAAAIQFNIDPKLQQLEQKLNHKVEHELGNTNMLILGSAYTLFQTKKIVYAFPVKPYVQSVRLELAPDSTMVILSWGL